MKKFKKVLMVALLAIGLVFATSCKQIKKAKVQAVETVLSKSLEKVGIENFDLPECEDIKVKFENNTEEDHIALNLELVQPKCTLEEFQELILDCMVASVLNNAEEEVTREEILEVITPKKIDGGYSWSLENFQEETGDITEQDVNFEILLLEKDGNFVVSAKFDGIMALISSLSEIEGNSSVVEIPQ